MMSGNGGGSIAHRVAKWPLRNWVVAAALILVLTQVLARPESITSLPHTSLDKAAMKGSKIRGSWRDQNATPVPKA